MREREAGTKGGGRGEEERADILLLEHANTCIYGDIGNLVAIVTIIVDVQSRAYSRYVGGRVESERDSEHVGV